MVAHAAIRHSPIAGTWYPGTARALRATLDEFMLAVPPQTLSGDLRALIAPHAGYAYSGPTAAHSYRQLAGRAYDTVVVAGPSHFAWVGDFAISAESAYETPLGTVPLDTEWIAALERLLPMRRVRGDREHSIEIQLPFLQHMLGDFRFVPLLMNADTLDACAALGRAIADVSRGKRILLVASSDMNHMDNYTDVQQYDANVLRAIETFDLLSMAAVLLDPAYTVCGRAPVLTMAAAAQALGAARAQVLHHTTSGDVTGRTEPGNYTVGYLSAAMVA
ncbi:MAG: AmmeMemoRadiSam system protein B [Chloroflexi bacterium]|nr:AmmeMemoRadiSam system protein B [Chloroflexota bacterium]